MRADLPPKYLATKYFVNRLWVNFLNIQQSILTTIQHVKIKNKNRIRLKKYAEKRIRKRGLPYIHMTVSYTSVSK